MKEIWKDRKEERKGGREEERKEVYKDGRKEERREGGRDEGKTEEIPTDAEEFDII